ncbi:ATP-binding cassette domain-containing protein [Bifidobacterium sp. ESL0822]|uniref:ATP-binding cassette domain-containing protein n=1 Tax=Bifidobacterium sp. ESL0822 TaxID=3448585 RepID=UPI004041C229
MRTECILIDRASTHNLKQVSLSIPKRAITVVTGLSGSGKSSLVFSTLAAESQRMINRSYSTYIQQLLPKYEPAEVARIDNLPFSIAITQKQLSGNARSTVGTYTDIYTALRLLFSRMAQPFIGYSMAYSFNNPAGMCPTCQGLGTVRSLVLDRLLNMDLSLNQGAIDFPTFQPDGWRLTRYTDSGYFDNDLPLREWTSGDLDLLLYGKKQKPAHTSPNWHKTAMYEGLVPRITKTFINQNGDKYQHELEQITRITQCPDCQGARVNARVRSAKIDGLNIADCSAMSVADLQEWLGKIHDDQAETILQDLMRKIANLITVGLGYLSLQRGTSTLSGGEGQRLKIANCLNSSLNDVLCIFDEPSVGLHPHDLTGIKKIFEGLRDKGNTVVIVDHDPELIAIADHIVDMGPGAGSEGGRIVFEGNYQSLLRSGTATGRALADPGVVNEPSVPLHGFYTIDKVTAHNVREVHAKIPRQMLTVVTGVAGSGKSTLIREGFMAQHDAILLDQKPIKASGRSNLLTYLGVFDPLRKAFAKATGKSASLFSFNAAGACPVCKGKGVVTLDIAYLGDTSTVCESCRGTRYSTQALSARYRGLSIAQALKLTASEAVNRYREVLGPAMIALEDVGLSYLSLGQALDTLSGGELQRLKLAKLLKDGIHETLILDEPTSGLHESNILQQIALLHKLITNKNLTVVAIEHNLRFIGQADWVIDMGPGAGSAGGKVLFEGTPLALMRRNDTPTAQAMNTYFGFIKDAAVQP